MTQWVQSAIDNLGLTHEKVAKETGVTREYITMIANGRRPSVDVAKRLAPVLQVEWTRFFEDEHNSA